MSTYKEIKTTQSQDAVRRLIFKSHRGYRKIACGCFGSVYAKRGSKTIIKIAYDDSAYLKFIKYVITNQPNPWLPKVKDVKVYKTDDGDVICVKMERLKPVPFGGYPALSDRIRSYVEGNLDNAEIIKSQLTARLWKFLNEAKKALQSLVVFDNCEWDLHNENLMRRGKQFVIIDPLC